MASNCSIMLNPMFQPAMRPIAYIIKGNPTTIICGTVDGVGAITLIPHHYVSGTIVRIDVPAVDGMPEINGITAPITVTSDNHFTVPIDSTNFTAFAVPADASPFYNPHYTTCAFSVPIGELNQQLTAAVHNIYG